MTDRWSSTLDRPDWYLLVIPELESFLVAIEHECTPIRDRLKGALYDFFEGHLVAGDFRLGQAQGTFDGERRSVDTVVIHHTSNPPGMSPERLSAIELMRLYAPYFARPEIEDAKLRGMPVSSGHVRDGRQVFWPYHWMIRENGAAMRLLSDRETGWHAGNWEVNCRSVAIVLDGDFELSQPTEHILISVAELIATHYPSVSSERVFGHREITEKTTCPSTLFLDSSTSRGWKAHLLELMESMHAQSR